MTWTEPTANTRIRKKQLPRFFGEVPEVLDKEVKNAASYCLLGGTHERRERFVQKAYMLSMQLFRSLLLIVAQLALVSSAHAAPADKQLENLKGNVTYQHGSRPAAPLAQNASIILDDQDFAATGDHSLAAVTLPDSSRVTLGSRTRVQLALFAQAEGTTAKFIVLDGKTRFKVQHPNGAKANYLFVTPVAELAVRGTSGDIRVSPTELQVTVYELGDPALPVVVTFTQGNLAGTQVPLRAGQTLIAAIHGATWTQHVEPTQPALAAIFSSEFGPVPATQPLAATVTPCDALHKMSDALAAASSYREVTIMKGIGKELPLQIEFVAPDRMRQTNDTPTTYQGTMGTSESITIGTNSWVKLGAKWLRVPGAAVVIPARPVAPPLPDCSAITDLGVQDAGHVYEINIAPTSRMRFYLRPDYLPARVEQIAPNYSITHEYRDWNTSISIEPPM